VDSIEAFLDQPKLDSGRLNCGNSIGIFFSIELESSMVKSLVELGKTCFEDTEKSKHDN
jgi:hypothetical protein